MPARDIYHDAVIHALEADITHDPLTLSYGGRELYVDLGAQRTTIAAEKMGQKIAVEIKSFLGLSPVHELERAIGQYQVYRSVLGETEPDRQLYLGDFRKSFYRLACLCTQARRCRCGYITGLCALRSVWILSPHPARY